MKITKNDVGRFAVTRGGAIVPIDEFLDRVGYPFVANGHSYKANGMYFNKEECACDLIQWADEHPKYKAVFTWPENKEE